MLESEIEEALFNWLPGYLGCITPPEHLSIQRQVQLPCGRRADVVAIYKVPYEYEVDQWRCDVWEVKRGPIDGNALVQVLQYEKSLQNYYGELAEKQYYAGVNKTKRSQLTFHSHLLGSHVLDREKVMALAYQTATVMTYSIGANGIEFFYADSIEPEFKSSPPWLTKEFNNILYTHTEGAVR